MVANDKVKVLVVDDEPGALESFRMILEIKDYEVVTFLNGPEALNEANKTSFDIAFIDICMPVMGGIEVLQKLKEISPLTQVIMLTAYPSEETYTNAITYGAMEYISKPFLMEEIFSMCERALKKRREQSASPKKSSGPDLSGIH